MLLGAGADKSFVSNNGYTALMAACRKGHVEVVRTLLDAGADKNFANKDGRTALMLAFEFGQAEVLDLLLDAGANFSTKTRGHTAEFSSSKRQR